MLTVQSMSLLSNVLTVQPGSLQRNSNVITVQSVSLLRNVLTVQSVPLRTIFVLSIVLYCDMVSEKKVLESTPCENDPVLTPAVRRSSCVNFSIKKVLFISE